MALKKQKTHHHNNQHRPVLLEETVSLLSPKKGESYLDLTAGYGGHAQAILAQTTSPRSMVLNDRDSDAIEHLAAFKRQGAKLIQGDFYSTARELSRQGSRFDMILADLGVSSPHFDRADRGFSLRHSGPLDMRMDRSQALTAADIVNDWPPKDLVRILKDYGEEPAAGRIARAIEEARPISSTTELAEVVSRVVRRRGKRHPATKTFQALRIAVNDELNQLAQSLPLMVDLLEPGGRLAIISFHSLEDRLVKRFFKAEADSGYEARLNLLTKHAVRGTQDASNPRARSARLRAASKIKNQKEGGS